jgi:hypothetical protein
METGHETAVRQQALHLLRERERTEAAEVLAACDLVMEPDASGMVVALALQASPETAERYLDPTTGVREAIAAALRDALPAGIWIESLVLQPVPNDAKSPSLSPDTSPPHGFQRADEAHNQATGFQTRREWQHLRFRSESELRIAQALERTGVLFLPNCKARLGPTAGRVTREPDFLICSKGTWGILEVDGEPFHPPERTALKQDRDRLFKQQGVRVVEHVDASRCFAMPDVVVREFLALLDNV